MDILNGVESQLGGVICEIQDSYPSALGTGRLRRTACHLSMRLSLTSGYQTKGIATAMQNGHLHRPPQFVVRPEKGHEPHKTIYVSPLPGISS